MPIRPGLLAEIQAALGRSIIPSLTPSSASNDIYEAYLFSLVLTAARTEGARITLASVTGALPNPFIFRTSPGYLNSRMRNYGYAVIEFNSCPILEAHVGIRVSGHSGVLHELDVSVLFQSEAILCRSQRDSVAPRSHRIVIGLEAKFYTTDLALHLGRAFLGLVRDTSTHNPFFVLNREAPSIEKLLAYKNQQWDHKIVPGETIAVARLTNGLQKAFHNFKAKYSD